MTLWEVLLWPWSSELGRSLIFPICNKVGTGALREYCLGTLLDFISAGGRKGVMRQTDRQHVHPEASSLSCLGQLDWFLYCPLVPTTAYRITSHSEANRI